MSEWIKAVAYVLITLFLGVVLREFGFRGAKLVLLLGTVSVVGAVSVYAGSLFSSLPGLENVKGEYTSAMMKMIGVGYVCGLCSDICSELGETGLSGAVCMLGRIEIIVIALPFIKMIIEKGVELL